MFFDYCGSNLIILACLTVTDLPCVFPFVYKNETYSACTGADSDNGAKWCATEVDSETREAVQNAWDDCQSGPQCGVESVVVVD